MHDRLDSYASFSLLFVCFIGPLARVLAKTVDCQTPVIRENPLSYAALYLLFRWLE